MKFPLSFTYLLFVVISQVCRRWRYLSARDDLWRVKVHELGLAEGVPNVLKLVKKSSKKNESIDWKLAFLELERITQEARDSIPVPKTFTFEGM